MNRNLKHWIVLAVSVAAGGLAAQTLDLSKPPLFLNGAVDPNLMVTFDDSGSMAWGYTPDNVDDGDCDWRYKRFYSPAFNRQYFNPAINYEPPLRADGSRMPDQSYTAALINGFNGSATTVNLSNAYFVSYAEDATPDRVVHRAGATSHSSCSTRTSRSFEFPTGSASAFVSA